MILRKSPAEMEAMAKAGKIAAEVHEIIREALDPGMSTLDIDRIAEEQIRKRGAVPSFKGYRGFTGSVCTSVNAEIVHGIPSADVVLAAGDLIKLDTGAYIDGYHSDTAVTWVVGGDEAASEEARALVRRTREALWAGICEAHVGNRVTDISAAVEARALPHSYGVVQEYVGHGVGRSLHEDPQVPNYGRPGRGPKLVPGLVLAVEPMFNLGTAETEVLDDDWTVVTADGRLSAHWEHTVAITADGPRVLTARSDEPEWPLADPARVPGRAPVDAREAG